jgi:hypothetical protein
VFPDETKEIIMKRVLSNVTFLLVLVLVVSTIPSFAQNKNESVMNVHVDRAVAIPRNVLEPGDYVFRLLDTASRPDDVAVTSADGKTFYGILPVFAASRDSGGDSEIAVTAPDEAGLARIDSWYFPGSQDGYRFIYSKSDIRKADMMAQRMKSGAAGSGM